MQFEQAFLAATKIFLDTAPVIYYIERNAQYFAIVQPISKKYKTELFKQ